MKAGVQAWSETVSDGLLSCELPMSWVFQLYSYNIPLERAVIFEITALKMVIMK